MKKLADALDRIPWAGLILAAIVFGSMPITEPHLIQKVRMLVAGELHRGIDWFDLFLHGSPLILIAAKLATRSLRSEGSHP